MYICKASKALCQAFQDALDQAVAALSSGTLSKQQQSALQKVVDFYGKANDANGVIVAFGKVAPGAGGHADSSKVFNAIITTITFDPKNFAGLTSLEQAEEEIHEGVHGIDGKSRGGQNPRNPVEELATERHANRTESYVPQGLGQADTAWGLWDPSWPAAEAQGNRNKAIEKNSQKSLTIWCAEGGNCK
jgi:hypothetical protein